MLLNVFPWAVDQTKQVLKRNSYNKGNNKKAFVKIKAGQLKNLLKLFLTKMSELKIAPTETFKKTIKSWYECR